MPAPLTLTTVSLAIDAFLDQMQRLIDQGAKTFHISPWNGFAEALVAQVLDTKLPCRLVGAVSSNQCLCPRIGFSAADPNADMPDVYLRLETDGDQLALSLMRLVDLQAGRVLAPRTARCGHNLPLFLISIPKAGTHLLMELARGLGYADGGSHDGDPTPGAWHYIEYSNCHTAASDFFIDTVRRSPFGNRQHPFPTSPALFIYRHPYDILVSEAEYYHQSGRSAFYGYLSQLSFEERLERLAEDPWLLGSLRARIGKFAPWLEFPNVAPVSFEELVGFAGGGDPHMQRRALWSIILKLQVDGHVDELAARVFNPHSPTFNHGSIGGFREKLTPRVRALLERQDADYLRLFGYRPDRRGPLTSVRIDEFRRRPLRLGPSVAGAEPILVEPNYLGWNLIRLRGRYFGFRGSDGNRDTRRLTPEALAAHPSGETLAELRTRIVERLCQEHAVKAVQTALAQIPVSPVPKTAPSKQGPQAGGAPSTQPEARRPGPDTGPWPDKGTPFGHRLRRGYHRGFDIEAGDGCWIATRRDTRTGAVETITATRRGDLLRRLNVLVRKRGARVWS